MVIGHQLLSSLEAQVACHYIGSCNATLLNADVIDCLLYFFLGNELAQILVINDITGHTSAKGLDAHAMISNFGHKEKLVSAVLRKV